MTDHFFSSVDPNNGLNFNDSEVCLYYTIENYNSFLIHNSDVPYYRLLNFNVRRFFANHDEIVTMLNSLFELQTIIILTEIWNSENVGNMCELDNFKSYHTFRKDKRGGDVSVFCLNSLDCQKVDRFSSCEPDFETCCVGVELEDRKYLIIYSIYRPPSQSIETFIDHLDLVLQDNFFTSAEIVVVAGDMNIKLCYLNHISKPQLCNIIKFSVIYYRHNQTIKISDRFKYLFSFHFRSYMAHFTSGILNIDLSLYIPN